MPDDIYGRYDDTGIGYAIVKPGTYKITKGINHAKASAYNVQTLDEDWYIPCIRNSDTGWIDDTASGILIHRAEDGPTNKPWSTGCITIEAYLEYDSYGIPHCPTMEEFEKLVGPSATLIVER